MIKKILEFKYLLPNQEKHTFLIEASKIFNTTSYQNMRELHNVNEHNYLFIPNNVEDATAFLKHEYDRKKIQDMLNSKLTLEMKVFDYVEGILDECDFTCTRDQLTSFCKKTINEELQSLNSDKPDESLNVIMVSKNRKAHLVNLLTQFAIEFLSEGSGMSSYVGGSFGEMQSNVFRIILDEMGEGIYKKKHSQLYEETMKSLGLSSNPKDHKDSYYPSTYLASNYVYYLCHNKLFYFRFLGSLFRNEACFINWQKQLSEITSQVFGNSIDKRYFDVHSIVDQDHGIWAFETIIDRVIDKYGESIIPEIVRGFFGYKLYQDINEAEFNHCLESYDNLFNIQNRDFKNSGQLINTTSQNKKFFVHEKNVLLKTNGSASIEILINREKVNLDNKEFILPAYFPVWIHSKNGEIRIFEAAD